MPSSSGPQLLLDTCAVVPAGCQPKANPSASSVAGPAIKRTPINLASGATPLNPSLLKPLAATMPPQDVPWLAFAVVGLGLPSGPSLKLR